MVPKLFLSHRLDLLVDQLVMLLDQETKDPFAEHTILVPNGQVKKWLFLEIAKRRGIVMGIKAVTLDAFCPFTGSSTQLRCQIYNQIRLSKDPQLSAYLEGKQSRYLSLTQQLFSLFSAYGDYAPTLFDPNVAADWQTAILHELFVNMHWKMPVQSLPQLKVGPIHCFGIDEMALVYWEFLFRSPRLAIYLFSPCATYWGDLCSDREKRSLHRQWKKRAVTKEYCEEIDAYVEEAPPLLANWGKLGRGTLQILDKIDLQVDEAYPLSRANSLLSTLQSDMLYLQSTLKTKDDSIKLFLTGSSKLKEIECLREEIIRLNLPYSDISVMAPNISPYVPLIEYVFADVPYRIWGVDIALQSSFRQGLLRCLRLSAGRWDAQEVIALFETPAFFKKRGWDEACIDEWKRWIAHAKIRWGINAAHKGQILAQSVGAQCEGAGTWEDGLRCLLDSVVYLTQMQVHPDRLEELIDVVSALQQICTAGEKTLIEWADLLKMVAEKFLLVDVHNAADAAAYDLFIALLQEMRADRSGIRVPFGLIEQLVERPAFSQIHGTHLHAVRFASLSEGSLLPAKAVFLIGMDEESFPPVQTPSSLDLIKRHKIQIPDRSDRGRYQFLEAIFSAQEFLRISYGHVSADEGKVVHPSLVVQELMKETGIEGCVYYSKPTAFAKKFPFGQKGNLQKPELPRGEVSVSVAELRAFARHPWKFYLQKTQGMYLKDSLEDSFPLQRGRLISASFGKTEEELFQEEVLPEGVIGEALRLEVQKGAFEWQQQLREWGLTPSSLILRESCTAKHREEDNWVAPPLIIEWEEGLSVRIVGEIYPVSEQGFICTYEDKAPGLLKAWPEALVAALVFGSSRVWMLRSGKVKEFIDARQSLRAFLEYYFLGCTTPSPLLHDWADALLRKSSLDFANRFGQRKDPACNWVCARAEMPSAEEIVQTWGPYLKETFAHLVALYPTRKKSEIV